MRVSMECKNEMEVMVVTDLAAICRKLAQNEALPDALQMKAREFVEEFESLLPSSGKGTAFQHARGEQLLIKIARFLPNVVDVEARPRETVTGQ